MTCSVVSDKHLQRMAEKILGLNWIQTHDLVMSLAEFYKSVNCVFIHRLPHSQGEDQTKAQWREARR